MSKVNIFDKFVQNTSHFFEDASAFTRDWYGRGVRFFKKGDDVIIVKNAFGAVLTLLTANLLVFQVAYRISHYLGEKNLINPRKRQQVTLGPIFGLTYAAGLFLVCRAISTPLDAISLFALHVTGFALSVLFTNPLR